MNTGLPQSRQILHLRTREAPLETVPDASDSEMHWISHLKGVHSLMGERHSNAIVTFLCEK